LVAAVVVVPRVVGLAALGEQPLSTLVALGLFRPQVVRLVKDIRMSMGKQVPSGFLLAMGVKTVLR
jgi:hypothetical protein